MRRAEGGPDTGRVGVDMLPGDTGMGGQHHRSDLGDEFLGGAGIGHDDPVRPLQTGLGAVP